MKRTISISLLTLILMSSSRLSFSAHFCGGELVSLEFYKTNKGCGKCGSTTKKHPCCKDVVNSVEQDDYNNRTVDLELFKILVAVPALPTFFEFHSTVPHDLNQHSVQSNAPPFVVKKPRYILFRSLIV